MQKRKADKGEECSGGVSKQQCTISTSQQMRNEAREKIIAERKERNRRSAAASRKRKDDEIIQLREEVKKLSETNKALIQIIMQSSQQHLLGAVDQLSVCTNSIPSSSTVNKSSVVEDDSNLSFSVVSDLDELSIPTSTLSTSFSSSDFTFSPNSSEPAVFQ